MLLNAQNVVHYLLDRGLLSPETVVDGAVMVSDASRRNRNFRVSAAGGGLFVKQVASWDAQAIATLQREVTCYWLADNEPAFSPLAELLPAYRDFDNVRQVLVLELLPEVENLSEYHYRLGEFPVEVAAGLGELLGRYHRQVRTDPEETSYAGVFPRTPPWILSAHRFPGQLLGGASRGSSQLVEILGRYPDFPRALELLRSRWRTSALIHGDVKWDNTLVYRRDSGKEGDETDDGKEGPLALKLIDWELADVGDPYWDVGAVFQAYLLAWVLSTPGTGEASAEELVAQARFPLDTMRPAIRRFWQRYAEVREMPDEEASAELELAVRHAGARLVQTAYEYAVHTAQLTAHNLLLLQLSLNVLTRPRSAREELLGL